MGPKYIANTENFYVCFDKTLYDLSIISTDKMYMEFFFFYNFFFTFSSQIQFFYFFFIVYMEFDFQTKFVSFHARTACWLSWPASSHTLISDYQ